MVDWFPAEHDPCEFCARLVCPTAMCVASDECMRAGNAPCPSVWTAYQLVVHTRCVPAFDAELEGWANEQERAHEHGNCDAAP